MRWRTAAELPPAGQRHDSPYDVEARYSNKRSVTWVGYKVHLTETCDAEAPHLITHVETTPAPVSDIDRTAPIHEALAARGGGMAAQSQGNPWYIAGFVLVVFLLSWHFFTLRSTFDAGQ